MVDLFIVFCFTRGYPEESSVAPSDFRPKHLVDERQTPLPWRTGVRTAGPLIGDPIAAAQCRPKRTYVVKVIAPVFHRSLIY